jgi:leucyl aminopeptidase
VKFSIKKANPEKQRSACVVVGVFEPRKLTEAAEAIDKAAGGYINSILNSGDMDGKAGAVRLLHNVPNTLCERVLLVGLGKEEELNEKRYRDSVRAAFRALNQTGAEDNLFLTEIPIRNRFCLESLSNCSCGNGKHLSLDRLKSKVDETPPVWARSR